MLTFYNLLPLYCPSFGTPTRLDRADNPMGGKLKAKQALSFAICGVRYQLAGNTEIFRAATASGVTSRARRLWAIATATCGWSSGPSGHGASAC